MPLPHAAPRAASARPLLDQEGLALLKVAAGIRGERAVGLVGAKSHPELPKLCDDAFTTEASRVFAAEDMPPPIAAVLEERSRERGNNWPFEQAGIPALFFGSGESDDYRKPSDSADRLHPRYSASKRATDVASQRTALRSSAPTSASVATAATQARDGSMRLAIASLHSPRVMRLTRST